MKSHEAMDYQQPYEVIEITSPDGTQTRRIGLVAVLSNDPKLYSHFKAPGAFGGAKIEDPWETLRKYEKILMENEKCDMILPLQHLYVPEDTVTCREFDFPVILSGALTVFVEALFWTLFAYLNTHTISYAFSTSLPQLPRGTTTTASTRSLKGHD